MTESWKKFAQKEDLSDSEYAKVAAGASKMGPGPHKGVSVAGISPVDSDDYDAIDVIWENEDGLTFQQRIFLTSAIFEKDSEGKNVRTDKTTYSRDYIKFGVSLVGDLVFSKDLFVDMVPDNPSLLAASVGCKANIVIGKPKKGFTIKNLGDNKLVIVDLESEEIQEDIGEFSSFEELRDAAKEDGIKLVFDRVLVNTPNKEYTETNMAQLKLAMDDLKKPVKEVSNAAF